MTAYLCPVFQEPQFTDNDEFLVGGLLWFYEAGSSTLAAAYTDETGSVAWSNPIVLNSRGESGGTIWLAEGTQYRIVLENKPIYGQTHGAVITDHDNISGINDPSVFSSDANWILFAGAPTYVSATSFTVAGDQRDIFAEHRRVYTINSGGTVYSSVDTAVYAAGITTVTVINDSGVLDVGLSAVYYSSVTPIALPNSYDELTVTDLTVTDINGGTPWTSDNNTFETGVAVDTVYKTAFANGLLMYRANHQFSFGVGETNKSYTFTYPTAFPSISFPPYVTLLGAAPSNNESVTVSVSSYSASEAIVEIYMTPFLPSGGPLLINVNLLAFGY